MTAQRLSISTRKRTPKTLQTFLVIPRGFLGVGGSLRKKLQNGPGHFPGAILRKRAKTSEAGTAWDSPAS